MIKNLIFKPDSVNSVRLLKIKAFIALAAFFLIGRLLIWLLLPYNNLGLAADLTADSILTAVNHQRSIRNLVLLNTNFKLSTAAQSKAEDMQARHYFAHIDPDGKYVWEKIVATGYAPYSQLGENLAVDFYETESLLSAWMNSPTHRANILQESFKDQGMGLAFGNASLGQYHSAIANTFGAMDAGQKPKAPKSELAQSTPIAKSEPKTAAKPKTETSSHPTPKPSSPIVARGNPIPSPSPAPIQTHTPVSEIKRSNQAPVLPVIGNGPPRAPWAKNLNRYFIIFCGLLLLFIFLADAKKSIAKNFNSIDKKFNNIITLFIALIILAIIYWT